MLNFLKSKRHKSNIDQNLYDWKYIDVSELNQYPDAIKDIYNQNYTGLIIQNVFSKEELVSMKKGIESIPESQRITTGVGYSFPKHFAQLYRPFDGSEVNKEVIKDYFEECSHLTETLDEILNVKLHNRLKMVFEKISGSRAISVPKGYDEEGRYAFGAIRVNLSNQGFIPVHCGNYFQQEFPDFYEHLGKQVEVKNQLSYFITVDEAEKGGELTLYDLLWEDGQSKENVGADRGVTLTDGTFIDTTENGQIKRQKIKPRAGDLLIFSGGPIWHKVELVEGNSNRMTIGGFLAVTEDNQHLKYWT